MPNSPRHRRSPVRKTSARSASIQSLGRFIEGFEGLESRTLLNGGPLTVVITELGTSPLESVTLVDSANTGQILYSTPTPSPFADFSLTNFKVTSNRLSYQNPLIASLVQTGTVIRTTTTGGNDTLEIQAEDYGYLYPATQSKLISAASVTYANGVAGDTSQFQSTYNDTTPSPIVTLTYTGGNPQAMSGNSGPIAVSGTAPFNLSNAFGITLAPSIPGGLLTASTFESTGTTEVAGINASIAGNVYLDNNFDGVLDTGDNPIPSITVTLTGMDANGNPIDETTQTAANGTYKFTNLTTGIYTVTETVPPGYDLGENTPGIPNDGIVSSEAISQVVITGGQALTNYNFGLTLPVTIGDFVWDDENANGLQDTAEPGINGVTLTLNGDTVYGAPVTDHTTTSGNGGYLFNEIPGTYTVSVDASNFTGSGALVGYTASPTLQGSNTAIDSNPNPSGTTPSTLGNAGSDLTLDFGYYVPVSINGTDYLVSNTTTPGSLTTSTTGIPIPGTTVTLTGLNAVGQPVNLTTTTNASGQYSFTGLSPSNAAGYTVTEIPPAADSHLGQTSTTTGAISTPSTTPVVSNIVLTTANSPSTDNFFETPVVALNGYDYLVPNTTLATSLTTSTTGLPIAGTTVALTGTDEFGNTVSLTTTTNALGFYSFTGLNPSNGSGYTVTETPPAGDTHVGQTSTTGGAISTPASTPVVSNIVLITANSPSTDNFFESLAVSLNGTDYLVSNTTTPASLTTSTTGVPIPGTVVTLSGIDAFGHPFSAITVTNASGYYSFTGLNPSNAAGYTVTETPPAADSHLGQTSTTLGAATNTPPGTPPVVSSIVLTTNGATSTDNYFETASVSLNGSDYLVNAGTTLTTSTTGLPIAGTTVTLTGTDEFGNTVSLTTTTNASGFYSFTGLNPSNGSGYTVTETPPAADTHEGQTSTTTGAVTTPASTPVVSTIVLATPGSSSTDNFFENPALVALNGYDYLVSNTTTPASLTTSTTGNPIASTTVKLTGTDEFGNPVSLTTTTNASGFYSFPGLNPSNGSGYTVTETPPAADTHVGQTSTTGGAISTPASTPVVSNIVLTTANSPSTDNFFETLAVSLNGSDYLVSNTILATSLTTSTTGLPIAGTTVTLTGTDAFGNTVSKTTTTNASGAYSFTGLNPSNSSGYTVTETPPAADTHLGQTSTTGGAITTPASTPVVSKIVLTTNGATSTDNYFETASVSLNGSDYLVNAGTTLTTSTTGLPIAGTTVTLTGTDEFGNTVSKTTTTNASGFYSFTGLNPSNGSGYTVTETPPSADTHEGQTSTTTGAVTTPASTPVVSTIVLATPGSTSTDNFFENPALVALNGYDYLVSNTTTPASLTTSTTGNPIASTTVKLTGTDEFGNPVSLTTTTNASGFYSFPGLNPSNGSGYTVTETPPASDTHVGQTSTTAGAIASTSPVVSNIVLTTANSPSTDNFFETLAVSLNGSDYLVSNTTTPGSLTTSTTGLPIAGTTVTLTGTDAFGNTVSRTTTTNASGAYSFTGLNPSNSSGYTVTETPPAADSHLGQTSTTGGAISTPASTPVVSKIVLTTNGATSTDNYFETVAVAVNGTDYVVPCGTTLTTSTTGTPIAGTSITLTGTDEFGNTVSKTTTTNASGQYSFPGLNPSNSSGYTVTEIPPSSYSHIGQTSTTAGAVTTPATSPLVSSIVLVTNGATSTDNFFEMGASITGTVYNDATGNGLTTSNQPPAGSGDTGEAGVTVDLENTSGTVIATTVTASNGTYSFNGLLLGSYLVAEVVPSNQFQTGPYQSTSVCSSIIADAGFETPSVASGNYVYNFTGSPWTFTGQSGVSGNGSGFTASNPNAPQGSDVAFLQSKGSFSQVVSGWSAGSYQLSFSAAQRAMYYLNNENFEVLVDGNVVGTFNPSGSSYQTYNTPSFYVSAGTHTISFVGLDTAGGDNTVFIDNVCAMQYAVSDQANGQAYYTDVLTAAAPCATNNNFANFTYCNMSGLTNVYYSITTPSGVVTWGGLNTAVQGDTITAYFTIKPGSARETLSLVAYEAPTPYYSPSNAYEQVITSVATGTFGPGTYSESVTLPNSYYQVDFVCGDPLTQLNLNGSDIDYEDEGRLNAAGNGGTQAYSTSSISGTAYFDNNKNDSFGSGDTELSNVKLTLTGTTGTGTSVSATTTTNSSGGYTFSGLVPGIYTITETTPSGDSAEAANPGSVGGTAGTGVISSIFLNSNTTATWYNFGNVHSSGTPELAAGSTSTAGVGVGEIIGSTQLHTGKLTVAVNLPSGPEAGAEQAAIANAIASLNSQLAPLGVTLVEVNGTSAGSAAIHISLGTSSPIGGLSQGVLGAYSADGDITLIQGWDWYFGTTSSPISPSQYDFQSVVIHELGHALGLGENSDSTSAMDLYLKPGQAHRDLTTTDLSAIRQELGASRTSLLTSQVSAVVPSPILSRSQVQSQTVPMALTKVAAKLNTPLRVVTQPIAQLAASASDQSVVDPAPLTDTIAPGSSVSLVNARQKAPAQGTALDQVIDELYGLGGSSIDLD